MLIGFDAKRFFLNTAGLGNYSRTLLSSLACHFPEHDYYLFTPKTSHASIASASDAMNVIKPARFCDKIFSPAWRSKFVTGDLKNLNLNIYHGLSNEIPYGIHRLPVKTIVTVHDVIFERYPHLYNPIDVYIYRKKVQYAARRANLIIAISRQTRQDLMTFYHVPQEKIRVVYQSCDHVFGRIISCAEKEAVQKQYQLPAEFLLYVGAITERKNLLTLIKAIRLLPGYPPLVVIGTGRHYKVKIKKYLADHHISNRVIWLCDGQDVPADHLSVIYRLAIALVYPSLFEGFGLPIQEALWSGTPVITSEGSCFTETGGNAAIYVNPLDTEALTEAIRRICTNSRLAEDMSRKGLAYVRKFSSKNSACKMMNIYKQLNFFN